MAAPFLVRGLPLRSRLQHHRLAVGLLFSQLRRPACTAAASDDPGCVAWKEILQDVEPITLLTKEILHSERYRDGDRLTAEDEKAVVDKLLSYHPNADDKIGCAIDSIMVDRHPHFRRSRCLFVVRTDGSWEDFSYRKCLREYIRSKYPSHAERFIRKLRISQG